MKYAVLQRYYDNGRMEASIQEVSDSAEAYNKEFPTFDEWLDVFSSKQEAMQCLNDCKDA